MGLLNLSEIKYILGTITKVRKKEKINPKMIGVSRVGRKTWGPSHKYPSDLVLLEGAEVTMYLLRESGSQ